MFPLSRLAVIALATQALSSVARAAPVSCDQVALPGIYSMNDVAAGIEDAGLVRLEAVALFPGAYRMSVVAKNPDGSFEEIKAGYLRDYSLLKLGQWPLPGSRSTTCAIHLYSPSANQVQTAMILESLADGTLHLGGDHETYDVWILKKIR